MGRDAGELTEDPWPLRVRVAGGRVNHQARRRTRRRWSDILDLACGASAPIDALDNEPAGRACPRCEIKAAGDRDPHRVRMAAAEERVQRAISYGQYPPTDHG